MLTQPPSHPATHPPLTRFTGRVGETKQYKVMQVESNQHEAKDCNTKNARLNKAVQIKGKCCKAIQPKAIHAKQF